MAQKSLLIDVKEMMNCLVGIWPDYNITVSNFNTPTCDFMIQFCERCLMDFCVDLCNTTPSVPEEFADVMYFSDIHKYMRMIFQHFNIPVSQIVLGDIFNPKSRRTKAIIRLTLNALVFWHNFLHGFICPLEMKVEQDIEKHQESEEELNRCTEALETLKGQLADFLKTKDQNIKEKEKLYRMIKELADEDIFDENQKLGKAYTDLEAEGEQVTAELNVLLAEEVELGKLIVGDANDIMSEYEALKKNLSELGEKDNHWNMEVKSKNESLYLKMLEQMEKTSGDAKEFSDIQERIDELKLTEETVTMELKEEEGKLQKLMSDLEEARDSRSESDQLEFMKADWEVKKMNLNSKLEHMKGEKKGEQQYQVVSVLPKLDQEIQSAMDWEKQMEEEEKQFNAQCRETYNRILNSKSKFYDTISDSLQRIKEEVGKCQLNFQ